MSRLSQSRIDAALAKAEPTIRKAFLDAIAAHKASINLRALAEALERGDIAGAVAIAQISPAMLYPLDAAITATFVAGGQMVAEAAPKFAVSFGFNGRATRAEAWARQNAAGLVVDIVQGQQEALQQLIGDRLIAGSNPAPLARQIRSVVGLAPSQVATVGNVRSDLEGLSDNYFTRTLRDKRFDSLVRKAIASGKPLSATDVDRITNRYAERALAHRATVISRTESLNALRAGRSEGVRQAVQQGAADGVRKRWSSSGDKRVRDDHRAMDGQERDLDQPYDLPDGSRMMTPGDSSLGAPASQVALCRCAEEFFLDWNRVQ